MFFKSFDKKQISNFCSYSRILFKHFFLSHSGVLKISDLKSQIFKGEKRFPTDMVMKYVELMSKFEVAIKISERFLLIPSLLPDKQKQCPVFAENDSEELRKAMNVNAYLDSNVIRRQYLMSYVPSGFWARLLTR